MSPDELHPEENKLIAERRGKLAAGRALGGAYPNDFRGTRLARDLHLSYGDKDAAWLEANPPPVQVAGRMMLKRVMGRASFAQLADRSGQIQIFLQAGRRV